MYVVGEMVDCLDTIEATIQSKQSTTEEYEEPETPGHFVTNVDKVSIHYHVMLCIGINMSISPPVCKLHL